MEPFQSIASPSALMDRAIHVWVVPILLSDSVVSRFEALLSEEERKRASRFRLRRLGQSFILTRGVLRTLLGAYLNVAPASVQFQYGAKGKPALALESCLRFNVSHSGGLALFAFTRNCDIGVDLEQIHPVPEMDDLANRFFCAEEVSELMAIAPDDRTRAFFRCWIRKEAYIKAIGEGLSVPLNSFRVTLQADEPAGLVHVGYNTNDVQNWTLSDIDLAFPYVAALAYCDSRRPVCVLSPADPAELLDVS